MAEKSLFEKSCLWPTFVYISWKSFLLFSWMSFLSARSSFVWTEWKLDSQKSHAAQGEFQWPLTCPGSELCLVYLLSNLKMGTKTRRACQLAIKTQDKHHKTCLSLQPLAEKSLVCGLIKTAASLERPWRYLPGRHPGNAAVRIYQCCFVFCIFTGCAFGGRFYSLEDTWHPDLGEPFGVMHCVQCYCEPVSIDNARCGQTC